MKSFETSGMFVQEMILVAFFLLILVEIRLLCIQHSRKRKVEVMAVNFLLLSVTYGILTDLLSDYLAIWEGKNKLLHIAAGWPAGILFFLIFADTGYLICRIRREDEKYKKELSVYSIKQTLDHLKSSATWNLHADNGDTLHFILPDDLCQFNGIIGTVKFRTSHQHHTVF